MTELERIGRLERMLDKFTIAGAGVNVEGDLHRGYAIDSGFRIGGISGSLVGACCTGSTCSTLTVAGCAFIGGTYLGDGTSCSPNPCQATGACCVGEDCSITTAAACATAGGIYQGDGTDCSPNPCLPLCVIDATLHCDAISASESKCGFVTVDCDGVITELEDCGVPYDPESTQYWFEKHYDYTPVAPEDCHADYTCLTSPGGVLVVHPPGAPTPGGDGVIRYFSGTKTQNLLTSQIYSSPDCEDLDETFEDITINTYCYCQDSNGITADGETCPREDIPGCPDGCETPAPPFAISCGFTTDISYADEYTTPELISNVEAELPAYDGDFNDSCSASRDLAEDESSLSIQRFKYKFTFDPAPERCSFCWIERFTPEVGGVVDTQRCETIEVGQTTTATYEVLEPSTNGEITIVQ